MNTNLLTLAVGCFVLLAAVCQAAPNPNNRVVGGVDATKAQFPHQVSLRNRDAHSCGGSIISPNYVMTAAHCVTYEDEDKTLHVYPAERMTVRAGTNDRFVGGVLVKVVEIIVHEDYGNFLNDIAVLRMEKPFRFSENVQAISLPTKETPADADIIISGWGRLTHGGDLPRYLQWNTLKSLSLPECQRLIGYGYSNMLCLIHEKDNGACNGDSGGPAHYNNEVVGIAGFVYGGCGSSNPDGYARVYYFVDWIRKHTDVQAN